jgi:RNA recognition motif-containing protein
VGQCGARLNQPVFFFALGKKKLRPTDKKYYLISTLIIQLTEGKMPGLKEEEDHTINKKRKLEDAPEIEIDVSAPEPPSKKALRRAKKKGIDPETATANNEAPKADQAESKKRSEYGVWIGNLPFNTTKEDVRKFFTSGCTFTNATITRIHLPQGPSRANGMVQNKGFAYVDFANKKAMDEAIALSENFIAGRRVLIKGSQSFEGRPEKDQQAGSSKPAGNATSSHPPSRRIFVGNLGFDATKEAVQEHFSPCGTITNVHLATFEDSGKCKGYGWVEFETVEAGQHAVNGFVKVEEEDDEEEEADESDESSSSSDDDQSDEEKQKKKKKTIKKKAADKKKPKTKKIWVNRLLGRQLRMEFAEDAVTRYKKRFGKDSKGRSEDENGSRRPRKETQSSRYSQDTVQRLTGAIVEAQGKKVTFD